VIGVGGAAVTLGQVERQGDLLDPVMRFCAEAVGDDSVYGLLHRERDRLFPDELFADLFTDRGRRSVPPSIVACVMVLQKLGGLSDREAAERFTFDARWRYAAGVGDWDEAPTGFAHTVLVDFRARLRASGDPERIQRVTKEVAAEAGLMGLKRALDSAPLFDAVATQDTVTLVRSAIRGLLGACDGELAADVRAVLARDDDYQAAGKPVCDWDDAEAREQLVDALARDGHAALGVLEGRELTDGVAQAAELLATVIGQDIETRDDGTFAIARRVAPDRVISTEDPEARHGRKTSARRFDGYKGHVAVDPDSEIITDTAVTPANAGDAEATKDLLAEFAPAADDARQAQPAGEGHDQAQDGADESHSTADGDHGIGAHTGDDHDAAAGPVVYGDAAYGSGDNLERLEQLGAKPMVTTQPAVAAAGQFTKDDFTVDLATATVTCPAQATAVIAFHRDGSGVASFGACCHQCLLRDRCTSAKDGRTVHISRHHRQLVAARARQRDPAWQADYQANRPKVERKLAHLVRHWHGGRRARMRGLRRVAQDWQLLAAAHNLARLAALGVHHTSRGWQAMPT
jgi:hypothetical protein